MKDIPFKEAATDHPFRDAGAHNGGRIGFSLEGHLFVTTGDNHNSNVQGIAFHPETGQPIITEHGPWHSDEVSALLPGANSGWDPRPNMAGRGDCFPAVGT